MPESCQQFINAIEKHVIYFYKIFIKTMINDEQILAKDALDYFDRKLKFSFERTGLLKDVIDDIQEINERVQYIFSDELKAFFINELNNILNEYIINHRNIQHNGLAEPTCRAENKIEKIQFYLGQQLQFLPIIAHQKHPNEDLPRSGVFISYSHTDAEYLKDIQRYFKPFQDKIQLWDDSKIQPGQIWKDEIKNAIDKAKVAILLISIDFLGSEFITSNELPPILEAAENQGAVILMVIVRPSFFEEIPILNQFQAMNPPSHPISKMSENEKEELYVNLVRQTKKILDSNKLAI